MVVEYALLAAVDEDRRDDENSRERRHSDARTRWSVAIARM